MRSNSTEINPKPSISSKIVTNKRNSNPFQLEDNTRKPNIELLKSLKIFQNFERQAQLTKNKSNVSIMNNLKSHSLTRNSNSVSDLMKIPSSLKPNDMKSTISSNINYNFSTIKKDDKDTLFKTLSLKLDTKNNKDYTYNNQVYT